MPATIEQVKSRPILFSPPMVRAILDGTKTQTRRIIKPVLGPQASWTPWEGKGTWKANGLLGDIPVAARAMILYSPWSVGDTLWVKESFWTYDKPITNRLLREGADTWPTVNGQTVAYGDEDADVWRDLKWVKKSSRFMPRHLSRITLEITDVRAQRLQDISDVDAIAEGVKFEVPSGALPEISNHPNDFERWSDSKKEEWFKRTARATYMAQCQGASNAIAAFKELWDSINGKTYPWKTNPWCWAITFKRVRP